MVELLRKRPDVTDTVVALKNADGSDYIQKVSYETFLKMQQQPSFWLTWEIKDDSCLTDEQRTHIDAVAKRVKLANMSPSERQEAELIEKLKRQGVIK
jgi:predicted transcriptional regulator YheO